MDEAIVDHECDVGQDDQNLGCCGEYGPQLPSEQGLASQIEGQGDIDAENGPLHPARAVVVEDQRPDPGDGDDAGYAAFCGSSSPDGDADGEEEGQQAVKLNDVDDQACLHRVRIQPVRATTSSRPPIGT